MKVESEMVEAGPDIVHVGMQIGNQYDNAAPLLHQCDVVQLLGGSVSMR